MAYEKKEWVTGDVITAADMNRLEDGVNTSQSMFAFKGNCTFENLPASGNNVNDTYYVTDKECGYTWNGSAWCQSGAYGISISELSSDIDNTMECIFNGGIIPSVDYQEHYYIDYTDGNILYISGSIYIASSFISIPGIVDRISISDAFTEGKAGYAFYDGNKNYISGGQERIATIPINAKYFRFTARSDEKIKNCILYKDSIDYGIKQNRDIIDLLNKGYLYSEPSLAKGYLDLTNGKKSVYNDEYYCTGFIEIPFDTYSIHHNFRMIDEGASGFCFYDEEFSFISSVKTDKTIENIPSNAKYIRGTDFSTTTHTGRYLKFSCGEINKRFWESDNYPLSSTIDVNLKSGYVIYTNGEEDAYSGYGKSDYISIPSNCKYYINDCKYHLEAISGNAFYDENKNYICGNQLFFGEIPTNAKYIRITNGDAITDVNVKHITFVEETTNEHFKALYPFRNKIIAFGGDSITFGLDDNTDEQLSCPWVKQVGEKLHTNTVNYGVSSATLGEGQIYKLLEHYEEYSDDVDIFGFMIGINDWFRGNAFGTINDNTDSTYLGCLNMFCKGIVQKWKPKDGKKVFIMTYPHSDLIPTNGQSVSWEEWNDGIRQVAKKYSIPICDVYNELGISSETDTDGTYWKIYSNPPQHSAHLTQDGANVFADYIANWVQRMFGI